MVNRVISLIPQYSSARLNKRSLAPINNIGDLFAEYVIVAGGGGGGIRHGGGGGGGGILSSNTESKLRMIQGQTYTVTVGAGGTSGSTNNFPSGNGSNSFITSPALAPGGITASGGGNGGQFQDNFATGVIVGGYGPAPASSINGRPGGSGGGSAGWPGSIAGLGTDFPSRSNIIVQGYDGGTGQQVGDWAGGGGGSAGGTGNPGEPGAGGNGGAAYITTITGTAGYFGGGGGGGSSGTAGWGGGSPPANSPTLKGGGADGTNNSQNPGAVNTGGGGGGMRNTPSPGSGHPTSTGGSGIVYLAYPVAYPNLTVGGGLTFNVDFVGRPGQKVYRFTAGTDNISWSV